jgi:hypothetical protein
MDDNQKIHTLKEFWENVNLPDGLYAVWVNKLIFMDGADIDLVNGINGAVVTYSEKSGFDDFPEWGKKFDEREIKVKFLEELEIDIC